MECQGVSTLWNCRTLLKRGATLVSLMTIAGLVGVDSAMAQDVNFGFASRIGNTGVDVVTGVAVDGSGNTYTTGSFSGTVDFDPGPGVMELTSVANGDIYVLKLDAAGDLDWAVRFGSSSSSDRGTGIAVDGSGDVHVTGQFAGTVDFDPGPGTFNLAGKGGLDVFVLKLDSNGNLIWAKAMSGTANESGTSIAVDASSTVYVTGLFIGIVDFDPDAGIFNLTSAGNTDIFVQKLTSAGALVWAGGIGRTNAVIRSTKIAVDGSGNVFTTGQFNVAVDFDPGAGVFNLSASPPIRDDVFVSKLDSSGDFVWAKKFGSPENDDGNSIVVDGSGNVYTTGAFSDTADLDPGAGVFNVVSAGAPDIFVQKLDSSGNFVYGKAMGGTGLDSGLAITLDASENVYITGGFDDTVDFDPGVGTFNLTSALSFAAFVQKLDSSGDFVYAKNAGDGGSSQGKSIVVDATGNVYLAGTMSGTIDFDPDAGTFNLTSAGSSDIFVSKLAAILPPSMPSAGLLALALLAAVLIAAGLASAMLRRTTPMGE